MGDQEVEVAVAQASVVQKPGDCQYKHPVRQTKDRVDCFPVSKTIQMRFAGHSHLNRRPAIRIHVLQL